MPTANLPADHYSDELCHIDTGVFVGWANVSGGPVYKSVLGIGDNPHFGDCMHRTIEPHLLHDFGRDFYGEELRLIITGYIRGYDKFESLEQLKDAMNNDRRVAMEALEDEEYQRYRHSEFFFQMSNDMNGNSDNDNSNHSTSGSDSLNSEIKTSSRITTNGNFCTTEDDTTK